jgi:S-phase kinase-associated protein 1
LSEGQRHGGGAREEGSDGGGEGRGGGGEGSGGSEGGGWREDHHPGELERGGAPRVGGCGEPVGPHQPHVVVKLPNVAARTLDTVLEYCNMHAGPGAAPATKPDSAPTAAAAGGSSSSSSVDTAATEDRTFLDVLSLNALHDLLIAANDLEIERLLDAICQKVAGMIKGKTPDEIRATFSIVNDLTPAAEAELHHKYAWAFDE